MCSYRELLVLLFLIIVQTKQNSQNNTVLIHTYSKVAHWGSSHPSNSTLLSSDARSEGRSSSSGHTLWTHRSDANIVTGQNLKNKKSPVYTYSISKASSKSDSDAVPQIQERFNPRPYFDYGKPPKKSSNGGDSSKTMPSSSSSDSNPSIVYGSPFASFPVFTKAQVSNPDGDSLYDSPYSSYNPPDKPKDDNKDDTMYNFPPLGPPAAPGSDDYSAPPDNNDGGDNMDNADNDDDDKSAPAPPSNSYLPPPAPAGPPDDYSSSPPDDKPKMPKYPGPYANLPEYDSDSYGPPDSKPPSTAYGPMPPDNDHMSKPPSTAYGPPDHDHMGKPQSTAYGPPDHDQMGMPPSTGYGPPDHDMMDMNSPPGPPITQTIEPHPHGYYDYDAKHNYNYDHPVGPPAPAPVADDMGPPKDAFNGPPGYGHIPQYLDHDPKDHGYDFYGHDHHPVYHEVTTTEAPEDMRVNKGQYSYYYLGRKLWYIPLYFSIYFIIYVTVLILKSIARHKVDFKHNLNDLHNKYRKSRNMDLNDVHRSVDSAIEANSKKYEFM